MKHSIRLSISFFLLVFLLSGCFLVSVQPLVSDEDAVEFSGISGTWEKDDQRWTFVKEGEYDDLKIFSSSGNTDMEISLTDSGSDSTNEGNKTYFVTYEDLNESGIDSSYFIGKFTKLNGDFYLDLFPLGVDRFNFESYHYVPAHTFSKVQMVQDSLSISVFKDSWIEEQIQDNRVRIKHEKVEDSILITASTKELQKFIIKYGNMAEAYRDPITLKRPSE